MSDHLGNVRAVIERSSTVIRTADYYPFGLVMHQIGEKARYGYQGQYAEDETESTGWNAFQLRMYDPLIGRWLQVDPMRQFSSSYLAMGNNPINAVDPDGGTCYDNNGNAISCPDGFEQYNEAGNDLAGFLPEVVFEGIGPKTLNLLGSTTTLYGVAEGATAEVANFDEVLNAAKDNKFLSRALNSNNSLRAYQVGAGGLPQFKGNQHVAYDDVLQAASRFKVNVNTIKVIKGTGVLAGVVGTGLSIHDIGTNGLNIENGANTVVGVVGFVPGYGWVVVGVYYLVAKPTAREVNRVYEWLQDNVRIPTDGPSIMRGFGG
ncbi:MAG: RHS repeat-associated core domain-containing protein [Bacteroidota bacterium]